MISRPLATCEVRLVAGFFDVDGLHSLVERRSGLQGDATTRVQSFWDDGGNCQRHLLAGAGFFPPAHGFFVQTCHSDFFLFLELLLKS